LASMRSAVAEVSTISFTLLTILCARFEGSVTTHWAWALPASSSPQAAMAIHLFMFILLR